MGRTNFVSNSLPGTSDHDMNPVGRCDVLPLVLMSTIHLTTSDSLPALLAGLVCDEIDELELAAR